MPITVIGKPATNRPDHIGCPGGDSDFQNIRQNVSAYHLYTLPECCLAALATQAASFGSPSTKAPCQYHEDCSDRSPLHSGSYDHRQTCIHGNACTNRTIGHRVWYFHESDPCPPKHVDHLLHCNNPSISFSDARRLLPARILMTYPECCVATLTEAALKIGVQQTAICSQGVSCTVTDPVHIASHDHRKRCNNHYCTDLSNAHSLWRYH